MEEWGNPFAELLKILNLRIVSSTSESITIAARSSKGPLPSCSSCFLRREGGVSPSRSYFSGKEEEEEEEA